MDDGGVGAELFDVSGDPVVEAGTDGDQHIGLVHRHVGLVGAMHSQHAEEVLAAARIGAQPH